MIDAAGLARGEMGEDLVSMSSGVSMHAMTRNVPPHMPQCSMSMRNTRLSRCIQLMGARTRRMRLAGGLVGRVGDDAVAVLAVRGEHAVVSGEMGAGAWNEGGECGTPRGPAARPVAAEIASVEGLAASVSPATIPVHYPDDAAVEVLPIPHVVRVNWRILNLDDQTIGSLYVGDVLFSRYRIAMNYFLPVKREPVLP